MNLSTVSETRRPGPGKGRKVLVVDDDAIQIKLVRAQLEDAGFTVYTAEDAASALAAITAQTPDAIVSDVVMDEVDGFSLCRMMREDRALNAVPIVLLSSHFKEGADHELAREVGACALIQRSPSLQPCIEALVRNLDRDTPPSHAPQSASKLHLHRVSHQLALLGKETIEAKERYQALFEHSNDGISILTPEGIVLETNRHFEKMLQLAPGAAVGLHVRDFAAPGHADLNAAIFREIVGRDAARPPPVALRRADGAIVYVEFTTRTLVIDGRKTMLTAGRDVTELVMANRKLAASERQYRTLVENIPEVLWSMRLDGTVSFISANVDKLCGYTPIEVLAGAHGGMFDRVHPDDVERMGVAMAATIERATPLDGEFRWKHRDGRWIWIHIRALVGTNAEGEKCIDGVFADVTQRKLLEEQLCQSQKVEAIGQLTAGIAHDFNNLLAVVLGNADFLAQTTTDAEGTEVVNDIREAARRALALTSRLLAFSRRDAAEPMPIDLSTVVDGIERMLARTLGSNVAISVCRPTKPAIVCADTVQLEQVIMNLSVNARDAMPNGGKLTIETANVDIDDSAEPSLSRPPAGKYVMLAVGDTGVGMDATTLTRIFEPFFTTKAKGKGTGLGLSTSYGIVRRFGGHCTVESTPGIGTTFKLFFPRMQ